MKATNKVYIATSKGLKQGVKISKDKYYYPEDIKQTVPFEHNNKFVSGTIKTHSLPKPSNKTIEVSKDYELEIKMPEGMTTNSMGDIKTSDNKYVHKIKTIKRPKARKARMNIKIENAVEINDYKGRMYQNANHQTKKENSHNKRQSKRK